MAKAKVNKSRSRSKSFGPPLTWDEVATLYDKYHPGGRRARTLPMDDVIEWAEKDSRFHLDRKDHTIHHINQEQP